MWTPESVKIKLFIIGAVTLVTLAVHYHQWTFAPLFGHMHWLHAIHGRLCYIPIVIAASWFGLRGGLYTAAAISVLVLPYVIGYVGNTHDFAGEMAEIVFYFAIAILIGVLVDREFTSRQKQQDAQLRMERSQKLSLVGQLAAGVAHEIKNPLASIKGAADILTDDDTSQADRIEFKDILQNEIRRIDGTVAEFLEFARPKETRKEKLNLTRTLRASLRQIEAEARRHGSSIQEQLEEDVFVNGDPEKLHQMTLNLILNAIHASHDGDTVGVSLRAQNRTSARLVFADSGSGISEQDLGRVFEPFYTTKSTGTGLGLTVVKDIIDNHQGTIRIDSTEARGTTVTIVLPLYTK